MVALKTRSSVLAIVRETTEGELAMPASADEFTVLREGFSFEGAVENVDSDELVNDIGASEGFVTKETPSGSIPKYMKSSGSEGVLPDWALLAESAFGDVEVHSSEPNCVSGSTAGSSTARAVIQLGSGQGAGCEKGQAFLFKDGVNGYSIRNIYELDGDDATLNFNLAGAPASGVLLGKPVHFIPVAEGHPTFSAHLWQASTNSGIHQAMAGCRTTAMNMELNANELSTVSFDFEGIKIFRNPIVITATTKYIDFNIGAGQLTATLTAKAYKTPIDLAREVTTKMTAAAGVAITCSFSSTTGKFTISKASGTLQLLWNTGTNTANTAGTKLGFSVAANDTGSLSYTADNALSYNPAYTPSYDDASPNVVKHNELLLGDYFRTEIRKGSSFSVALATPKSDVDDFSAETGVSETVVNERTVEISTTLLLQKHEVDDFDNFINNTTTQFMFNHGPKSGGNWVPGKCHNMYSANAKITSDIISDNDGIQTRELTIKCFVSTDQKDFHYNIV